MNIVICGGRDFDNYKLLSETSYTIIRGLGSRDNATIVSGMAKGADSLGIQFAIEHGYSILEFSADWKMYGKSAGYIRNKQMLEVADAVIAFWDGKSKGTANMIKISKNAGLPVFVVRYDVQPIQTYHL